MGNNFKSVQQKLVILPTSSTNVKRYYWTKQGIRKRKVIKIFDL